jgi:hypothetical protein
MKSALMLSAIALSLAACVDKEAVVFATGSSLGIDADPSSQRANVGFDRYEFVTGPSFSKGVAPPVYGRFAMDRSIFQPKVVSVHSTGAAALVATNAVDGFTSTAPELLGKKEKKRVFFGTATTTGFKVGYSTERPPSISLGVKRQELSIIPMAAAVTKTDGTGGTTETISEVAGEKVYGSVIGSLFMRFQTESMKEANQNLQQHFATGGASVGIANCLTVDSEGKITTRKSVAGPSGHCPSDQSVSAGTASSTTEPPTPVSSPSKPVTTEPPSVPGNS